jgi:hypothetical protein
LLGRALPPGLQVVDVGANAPSLSRTLQATMADTADQFLAAAYDVLMSNVRKARFQSRLLQPPADDPLATLYEDCRVRLAYFKWLS